MESKFLKPEIHKGLLLLGVTPEKVFEKCAATTMFCFLLVHLFLFVNLFVVCNFSLPE